MRSATVLGCRVDAIAGDDAVRRMAALAAHPGGGAIVVTLGTEMVVHAQRDPEFRAIVGASALSLCDTIGVRLAAALHGVTIAERVSGVDVVEPLCRALADQGTSVYVLGGKGDTAARAAEALRARVPALRIAGTRDGYFSEDDEPRIVAEIASSGAGALFAGLGSPRQERFLARRLAATGCGLGIGIGGSLDVFAGNVVRAPLVWQRLNLEWLYRLAKEPSRWRRQLALPQFVWLVVRDRFAPTTLRRSP